MTQTLVELSAVTRVFPGAAVAALSAVTASIPVGARIALVGRSGSGKSTLLNIIAGLDVPSTGEVLWPTLGKRADLLPGKIGVMFQQRSLIPWLSVVENVALPLQIAGRDVDVEQRAIAALDRFDLAGLASKLPEELSGGQAQRVSLARATVVKPRLLLADEPTGQLDQATASSVLDQLVAWAAEHESALLIATHDRRVASRLAQIWTLDHGQFLAFPSGASI